MKEKYMDWLRSELTKESGVLCWHEDHGSLTQSVVSNRASYLQGIIWTGYALEFLNSNEKDAFSGVVDIVEEEALRSALGCDERRKNEKKAANTSD